MAGLQARGPVFAVIFVMNLVFIMLGSLGLLPLAAQITAVALGGVAIAVMMAVNIVGDVAIARRMFAAPGAYLYALTPVPRRKTLLASVITMTVMDLVTLTPVIIGEVWLALNLAGRGISGTVWNVIRANASILEGFLYIALLIAGYLLFLMVILFCVTARKSILFRKPAGGWLAVLLAVGVLYAVSLTTFIVAPFGAVSRFGLFFTITLGSAGVAAYTLLTLAQAAVLFILTSRLMERKMNI